jgi:glycosyltransferase involved in cell wall biosynthesis
LIFNWRDLAHPLAGGAEVYTHRVAEEWLKMGHEVTLFCSSVVGKPEIEDLNGLKIIRRGGKHSVYREAKKYYIKEGRGNFDLVIDEVNTRPFGTPKWVDDTKVIALIHQVCREIWFYQVSLPIAIVGRYVLEPYWLRTYKNKTVVTVSDSSKKSLEKYGLLNVTSIPEGFEFEANYQKMKKESVPTLLYLGRLSKNKRPDEAIDAFRIFKNKVPNAVLWVIGTGPMERTLKNKNVEGVIFFGKINEDEKWERIARATALLVTSVREGWGMVVTEAAAVDTPSIAYHVDGLIDSVKAAKGYFSHPTSDSLAEQIFDLVPMWLQNGSPVVSTDGVVTWKQVGLQILEKYNEQI